MPLNNGGEFVETRYTIVDGELRHYGVLGMKWGIRKARKAGVEYAYKSHGQKKYIKKVSKLEKKGKTGKSLEKAQKKLDTFTQRDRNRLDYVKSTGVVSSNNCVQADRRAWRGYFRPGELW